MYSSVSTDTHNKLTDMPDKSARPIHVNTNKLQKAAQSQPIRPIYQLICIR